MSYTATVSLWLFYVPLAVMLAVVAVERWRGRKP